ncbi:hypothetical protein VTO42DRAFT_5998 [Malbranchea cinnamomea]
MSPETTKGKTAMSGFKLGALALLSVQLFRGTSATSKECPADVEPSCSISKPEDTCCVNHPGGLILVTEFWDTDPATGPDDSWTLHGLWPDNCDGSYEQYCDPSREYENITAILESHDQGELLDYMNTFWKDYQGDDDSFWAHEWNKHGTCMSTLEVDCYLEYTPQEEVKDYFAKAVELHKSLNTYQTLADAGIVPDSFKTYTLAEIQAAISEKHGYEITLNCRNGELNEAWYFYNIKGSVQTGEYIPTEPAGSPSTCPKEGIRYLPKN